MKKIVIWGIAALLIAAAVLTAVLISGNTGNQGEDIKIAYICKQLSNTWFQQVSDGISDTCKKYGMSYIEYDANFDDKACLRYVDDAIAWGADGMLICTTNQGFGPEIAEKCERAGVLVVTIDDTMWDANKNQLPHIGMATTELCTMGGTALAKMAKDRGFFQHEKHVKVIQIDVPELSVFQERMIGYREALISQTPLSEDDFIVIDSETGMLKENLAVVEEFLSNYPVDEYNWIIAGGNDESALAPLFVLREHGINDDQIIACGLGLSSVDVVLEEFRNGNKNYISIAAQPTLEGQIGAEMVYEKLVNDSEMKSTTVIGGQIITSDNYKLVIQE